MTEGQMLYLALVLVAFFGFAGGLMWGMVQTTRPRDERARDQAHVSSPSVSWR